MIGLYLLIVIAAANLPWLSERTFLVFKREKPKPEYQRFLEWLIFYCGFIFLGWGIERKISGETYSQDWEFYAVTFLLFLVFAIPGFIYCHDLKNHLKALSAKKVK